MTSEPTPSEVQRELDRFRQDVRDDLVELRNDLATLKARIVFADVYAANERRRDDAVTAVKESLARFETALTEDRKAARDWRERRDSNRKWLIAAVVLPIGGVIAELITALRGVHW